MDVELTTHDISSEEWREYEWAAAGNVLRRYRIERPMTLVTRPGGTTHRVVDANGITHCVPTVGYLGCALTWKANPAVEF